MTNGVYHYDLEKEKQISVDPISLNLPRIVTAQMLLPPQPPLLSLPNSPRFGLWMKKRFNNDSGSRSLRKCSTVHPRHLPVNETQLRRSKSCAEGRSSGVDELEIWFKNPDESVKPRSSSSSPRIESKKKMKDEEEFKCGALCLYLPGFGGGNGKVKPVRERKAIQQSEAIISRTVSLEKFECGSWASSAIMNDEVEESTRFYYELPMEMIRTGANETNSPVAAAFVFENDRKGVLKKNGSTTSNRKPEESSARQQVRFSRSSSGSNPSSPVTCITPRLRKAREEFNAFLEAEARIT
ncbi:hypothetical protein LINPERPRIM_LOCUS34305 [Linum perenne]